MRGVERRDRRIRHDLERRIELHRTRAGRQHHHVGHVGAPQDACGHEVVSRLGRVVDAYDGDQGTLLFRRLQGSQMASISSCATGGAPAAAGAGGRLNTQVPKPANESATSASPPQMTYRTDTIGLLQRRLPQIGPRLSARIFWRK
jgi:hypothetical protein